MVLFKDGSLRLSFPLLHWTLSQAIFLLCVNIHVPLACSYFLPAITPLPFTIAPFPRASFNLWNHNDCHRFDFSCTGLFFHAAMDNTWQVEFRNVGCSYFPQSRVDCHFTLSAQHKWASSDWVGLFKVFLL